MSFSFPLLTRLRQETSAAHAELEAQVDIVATLDSPEKYARLLAGFYGFHRAVEERLEAVAGLGGGLYDPAARRKSPWLAEDLRALGWSGERLTALPFPRPDAVPEIPDAAAAMGCAYVMEGSTLGGRHISGLLEKSGAIPVEARRFFQSYGEATREKWAEFLHALAVFEASADVVNQDRAVHAARETFRLLGVWLKAPPSP